MSRGRGAGQYSPLRGMLAPPVQDNKAALLLEQKTVGGYVHQSVRARWGRQRVRTGVRSAGAVGRFAWLFLVCATTKARAQAETERANVTSAIIACRVGAARVASVLERRWWSR
jgi:hypothetical protein